MNLTLNERIALMAKLGEYFSSKSHELQTVKEEAFIKNSWFIPRFVDRAIHNISRQYLQQDKLQEWISHYPDLKNTPENPKNVGMVMAGNIPAVGFHDLLCGIISGHNLTLKLSSKDDTILKHVLHKLKTWAPALEAKIRTADMLKGCDAYIATGNNNSARYFEYYFGRYPHIIRKNRTSVAILRGDETPEELQKLSDDVFLYFGLGCRNVTKIFVPQKYDFTLLFDAFKKYGFLTDFHHYKNNYDYQLSLSLLNKQYYMTNGTVLLRPHLSVFSPVSVLHYEEYDDWNVLQNSLSQNEEIQCMVSEGRVAPGTTQKPGLSDYADKVDTMEFLISC